MDKNAIKALLEKRKSERPTNNNEGMDWFWLAYEKGSSLIRILPALEGEPYPGRIILYHKNIPEIEKVTCLKTFDLDCPICNLLEEFDGRTKTADWERQGKGYVNVQVVRDDRKEFKGKIDEVFPCGLTEFSYEWFLGILIDDEVGGDITDPLKGKDIKFERDKDGGKFKRTIAMNSRPIAEDQEAIDAILAKRVDFHDFWKEPTEKGMEKIINAESVIRRLLEAKVSSKKEVLENYKEREKKEPAFNKKETDDVKEVTKTALKKPSDAPECFGNKEIYDAKSDKCGDCPQEFGCANEVGVPY